METLLSTGKALTNSLLFSVYGFDRPLTNYLVQNLKCVSACMCASICFIKDDMCNLNNRCSVIITKVVGVGHESCQLALLQIHAIQPSWTLTAIQQSFVFSFFFSLLYSPQLLFHTLSLLLKSRKIFLYISYQWMTSKHTSQWLKLF